MVKRILYSLFLFLNFSFASTSLSANAYLTDNGSPLLSNFRIESPFPDRIYFDSNISIVGTSAKGFILNDNEILNVFINKDQLAGHYFTVSNNFEWFHNNSIRYEGGGDLKSSTFIPLKKFPLESIINTITPKEATNKEYYVNASIQGSGNGLTENTAFKTINDAVKIAQPGDKIWIKSGNYGAEKISFSRKGSAANPIVFEGYKEEVGDIDELYFKYSRGKNLDSSEMPLLDGNDRSTGRAINFDNGADFIILRNLQITNYSEGIRTKSIKGIILENILVKDIGGLDPKNPGLGLGIYFKSHNRNANYNKFLNCIVVNATGAAFLISGQNNFVQNSKAYCDEARAYKDPLWTTDYYFIVHGSNNIIRNSLAFKNTPDGNGHLGHGFSLKGNDYPCEYNLIEKNTSINIYGAFEARHPEVKFNVFKDLISHADVPNRRSSDQGSAAVNILQGAESNIFERIYGYNLDVAIRFGDNTEDNTHISGKDNIVRNSIFHNVKTIIKASNVSRATTKPSGNVIINNTFNRADYLFALISSNPIKFSNNNFINNVFNKVNELYNPKGVSPSGWNYKYNNFYEGFDKLSGEKNISVDPKFEDINSKNFKLKPESKLIDAGWESEQTKFDFDGKDRPQGAGTDIGAYEKTNENVSFINANAGDDVEVCIGETITLIGQGNGDFLWSTGETTATIEVSPEEITEYTLTVTNGDESESDSVTVVVNESPFVSLGEDIKSCPGELVTLTVTGNGNFLWSTGETEATIEVTPETTTAYSVTASNSCGTSISEEITIEIESNLIMNVSEDMIICEGEIVTIEAESNGDYLWNTGETTPSILVNPSKTALFEITSTLGGCSITKEIEIIVIPNIDVNLGDDITLCSRENVTLTANGVGDFLWSTGEITKSIEVSPLETTIYSVTLTNECGMISTDEITVSISSNIGLDLGNDIDICSGEKITLSAQGSGDFLWNTGETTKEIEVSPNTTSTFSVTVINDNCSIYDEIDIIVNEPPFVSLGEDILLCDGDVVTLTAEGNGNFLWSTGETTKSITVAPALTTVYSVTASNLCGASSYDEITITVGSNVELNVTDSMEICAGEEIVLSAQTLGTVLWSTGEISPNISVSPRETTEYNVVATIGSCSVSKDILVTVKDLPSVSLGNDKTICAGESIRLEVYGEGNYLWSTGETSSTLLVSPSVTTTYIVTANNSCGNSVSDQVTVFVKQPPKADAGKDVTIYKSQEVILEASGGDSYLWNTGDTTRTIVVSPNETKTYSVEVSNGNCLDTDEVDVFVNEPEIRINTGDDITICRGNEVVLEVNGFEGEYFWSTGETGEKITVNPEENTTYSVKGVLEKSNLEKTTSIEIKVRGCFNSATLKDFNAYPNPTSSLINIAIPAVNVDIKMDLINLNGVVLIQNEIKGEDTGKVKQIDLSNLPNGVYFVRIYNEILSRTKKVIVI